MLDWTPTGEVTATPGNGTRPKRSSYICERLSSTPAKAWRWSTPVASSASPSKDTGTVSERRGVLHAQGSADFDGTLADSLQHGPSTQQSRGQPPAPQNDPACELRTHMVGGTKTPGWSIKSADQPLSTHECLADKALSDWKLIRPLLSGYGNAISHRLIEFGASTGAWCTGRSRPSP